MHANPLRKKHAFMSFGLCFLQTIHALDKELLLAFKNVEAAYMADEQTLCLLFFRSRT